jgi:hypothetical protein
LPQLHADCHPDLEGSLPGPSPTITVEPLRRPRTPDLIEPVIGYRLWPLIDHTLTSPFASTPWHRPHQRARCDTGRHEAGEVPAKTCSCGMHAYYDPCPRTERLHIPAVTHRTLGALAREHGAPLQRALRPRRTRGGAVNAWSHQP